LSERRRGEKNYGCSSAIRTTAPVRMASIRLESGRGEATTTVSVHGSFPAGVLEMLITLGTALDVLDASVTPASGMFATNGAEIGPRNRVSPGARGRNV
jgi:hypothetical protein